MNIFEVAKKYAKHGGIKRDKIEAENERLRQAKRNVTFELNNALREKVKLDSEIELLQSSLSEVSAKLKRNHEILATMDDVGADAAIMKGEDVSYIKDKKPWSVEYNDGKPNLIPKHLRGRKKKEMTAEDELDVLDFL